MTTKSIKGDYITATKFISTFDLKINGKLITDPPPKDGDILRYDAGKGYWTAVEGTGGLTIEEKQFLRSLVDEMKLRHFDQGHANISGFRYSSLAWPEKDTLFT